MAIPASARFRVIYHAPICPQCGSPDITTEDVETGDGFTETAYLCTACGEAWPLACVTDWDTRTPHTTEPAVTGIALDLEGGQ
jgi:hypothetical protein